MMPSVESEKLDATDLIWRARVVHDTAIACLPEILRQRKRASVQDSITEAISVGEEMFRQLLAASRYARKIQDEGSQRP